MALEKGLIRGDIFYDREFHLPPNRFAIHDRPEEMDSDEGEFAQCLWCSSQAGLHYLDQPLNYPSKPNLRVVNLRSLRFHILIPGTKKFCSIFANAILLVWPERIAIICAFRLPPIKDKSPIRSRILWRTISSG